MSGRPLRFLHASDLHLEQPLHGMGRVPDHLRELFVDAPLSAASAVFETALTERVDFVLLAGDILQPQIAGPRGTSFLQRHLQQLHDAKISVYWCTGSRSAKEHWPGALPLPPNVNLFDEQHVEAATYRRGNRTCATILGRGGSAARPLDVHEFESMTAGYTVALWHGSVDPEELCDLSLGYWALGGRHNRGTLATSSGTAHYCGSPQGREPREEGPHGCTLVEVNERGESEMISINTDVFRWHTVTLELPSRIDREGLLRLLRQQTVELVELAAGRHLLISWVLTDADQLADTPSDLIAARLRQGDLAGELLADLRREFEGSVPGVWPVAIEAEPSRVFPAGWYEEDTVLGDLLRAVQHYQSGGPGSFQLEPSLDDELARELASMLAVDTADRHQELLRHVAALAVDVLRGDRVLSEELAPMSDAYDSWSRDQ